MESTRSSLLSILESEVSQLKDDYCYPDLGRAFQHWAAVNVLGLVDEDVATAISGNQTRDRGIDYFYVDEDASAVNILQTKFSKNFDIGISDGDISSFFSTPARLSNGNEGNSSFHDYRAQYADAVSRGFKTNLIFIMTGNLTDTNKDEIRLQKSRLHTKTTFDCLENKDLPALLGNPPSPPCKIDIVDQEVFVSGSSQTQTKKAVATVRGSEISRIYDQIGSSTLFSANPRKYLGTNPTSRGIKQTLDEHPSRLWHYNNGISAVCKAFEYDGGDGSLKIENLKIVNGCQTVTTISKHKGISADATILLRLSQVSDHEFLRAISTNTNKQRPIKEADLYSDRDELRLLAKKFRDYPQFFWERKRGDFRELDSKTRSRHTKGQRKNLYVIDNDTAARLKLAFGLSFPHLSIHLGQNKIFSDDELGTSGLRPFTAIYDNAEPIEFILPNIFMHLLKAMDVQHDKESKALVGITIGRYYVVGLIGKILKSMHAGEKQHLENQILDAATEYNDATMTALSNNTKALVNWTALALPPILDGESRKPLSEYPPTGLRDALKNETVISRLYDERRRFVSLWSENVDPFEEELNKTFGV